MANDKTKSVCIKCGGKGRIPCFSHYADGVCFACGGKGEYSHPVSKTGKKVGNSVLFEVVNQFAVWQFRVWDETHDTDTGHKLAEPYKDSLVQAVTGAGRTGTTLFRIRLRGNEDIKVARRIYRAAMDNVNPADLTNEWLGFTPGSCQVGRNQRGVSFL